MAIRGHYLWTLSGVGVGTLLVLRRGEVFKTIKAKEFQKSLGCSIQDGAAGDFGSAGDSDQMLFHEAADGLAAGDAADGLDVGTKDRLLVGNDGQCLQSGFGESGVGFPLVERLEGGAVFRKC